MTNHVHRLAAAGIMIAAIALILVVPGGSPTAGADLPTPEEAAAADAAQSDLLTTGGAISDLNAGEYLKQPDDIERKASSHKAKIPLPPGGSLEDANVRSASEQGGTSDAFLQTVLQNNAKCDWYRYAVGGGANDKVALRIIGQIPNWPAFRHDLGDLGETAKKVADALARGDRAPLEFQANYVCNPDL